MSVLVTEKTIAILQGLTGKSGQSQAGYMLAYGTSLVAGVTPGRGGATVQGLPVFDTVNEAVEVTGANASMVMVPAPHAAAAAAEAIDAGLNLVVVITEHMPIHDAMRLKSQAQARGVTLIGPNSPGVISPGIGKLGIMPVNLFARGPVGIATRSGTLSYEVAGLLTEAGLGISTCVGIGGDRVTGSSLADILLKFKDDPETAAVVILGEIGGRAEEDALPVISTLGKPVVALIAGLTAPPGKKLGHAGAIIASGVGSAAAKQEALAAAGTLVAAVPADIPVLLRRTLV